MTAIARTLLVIEATHSTALDGMTQSVPYRQRPGFGCPHCGAPVDIAGPVSHFLRGLPCCGYLLTGAQLARFTAARLALRERTS